MNEKLDDATLTLLDEKVLQCSIFQFYGSYTSYGDFIDGKDGYWYGFSNPVGIYTLVEEKSGAGSKVGLGRLKSGVGRISLAYVKRV